ncbi:unnamed protein product [Rotaria sp. Silwood2]|nr:unnamed protein product [Rotaria sp. Silwood2]CAF2874043.1 unnamed protein product [Rotaria sp. Silwood2]CAF3945560.1 unnamed protein product [Rotaria sp. Silwood2]CAF4025480.1 unnamed protein product [Rotaria sp. Silwood2]CAF4172602.1 unnamed protein product [Rotaria sp. Silwood2]
MCGFQGEVKFQLTYSSGGAIDASTALREVNSIFHQGTEGTPPSYGMAAANLYEPPPPSYQAAQATNNHFAETTMYVSQAQAPYEGVYQRQPKGLPPAEFIPQYPDISSVNVNNSTMYPSMADGYQSQTAYQDNGFGGQMSEKQNYQMPPSYEQSQNQFQQKKHA